MDFTAPFWQKRFLLTDSRQVTSPANSIFFAIEGERHDGHHYIQELYQKGVRHFVVEKPITSLPEDAIYIEVSNSIDTLQQLAQFHRNQFTLPIIAITGSNGKTIIKEWLYELLEANYAIVKSPKSYNSQIGVPLSIWQIQHGHQLGIFEAGISKMGEMEKLASIIQPHIGIFSNIGTAHQEGFESQLIKVQEKLKLFTSCETLIYCADHPLIHQEVQQLNCNTFSWGKHPSAHLQIIDTVQLIGQQQLTLSYQNQLFTLIIPFTDWASVENSMHCIACMLLLQLDVATIQHRIERLHHVHMRLELKQGIHQCLLVDDTYNNDFAGLVVALDFMSQQDENKSRTVILSDILESGRPLAHVYTQVNQLLAGKNIQRLIGIGKTISQHASLFNCPDTQFFDHISDFFHAALSFHNELILVKGARNFGLEQVVHYLQQKVHGTRLEINLEALAHNLNVYRGLLRPETKIMVMVKAFAYGSGGYEVARLLQYHRVDYLAVAYADEGVELRQKGIKLPIMVMSPSPETFEKIITYHLEPEIYNFRILQSLLNYLEDQSFTAAPLPVHLKLDTGMHRLGFESHDFSELIPKLKSANRIRIKSVFTHLAGSDEAIHNHYSQKQLSAFQHMTNQLQTALHYPFIRHALNSPGITRFPNHQLDMVRLGIGLYGVDTNNFYQNQLQAASTLKTTISQIRQLKAGETVGYSRRGKVERDATIAVMAIGYADGYDRRFSNGVGKVLINGQIAPVIGNVCMDMTMLDITGLAVHEGDEVILFGTSPSIDELATAIGTIPYEILTNVSDRVKRVFYRV
ncbi:MAG: bifunctional UDP-N-acetylmuramoyl-tripeptide:D-alanyl-D-alanine ligase/alanine racemase [Flammeovirgaceae bacterium]